MIFTILFYTLVWFATGLATIYTINYFDEDSSTYQEFCAEEGSLADLFVIVVFFPIVCIVFAATRPIKWVLDDSAKRGKNNNE